jgi:hypothetical protein
MSESILETNKAGPSQAFSDQQQSTQSDSTVSSSSSSSVRQQIYDEVEHARKFTRNYSYVRSRRPVLLTGAQQPSEHRINSLRYLKNKKNRLNHKTERGLRSPDEPQRQLDNFYANCIDLRDDIDNHRVSNGKSLHHTQIRNGANYGYRDSSAHTSDSSSISSDSYLNSFHDQETDDDDSSLEMPGYSLENYSAIDLELDKIDVKLGRIKSIINVLSNNGLMTNNHEKDSDESVLEEKVYIYETVTSDKFPCSICLEETFVNERMCCQFKACNACVNTYIQSKIMNCSKKVPMECLNTECKIPITREEINDRMLKFDKQALNIYLNHLNELNSDANNKTCPKCCTMLNRDEYILKSLNAPNQASMPNENVALKLNTLIASSTSLLLKRKFEGSLKSRTSSHNSLTKVQCAQCQFVWCFSCHAPWHESLKCSEYKKGDKLLKNWSREHQYGQQNAQVCPKCKVYIQRNSGCDTMNCSFCNTEFCYKCGCKFRHLRFIGDHYSRFSILGCKYRFYPDKPLKRKIIRGSVLSAKIASIPLIAGAGIVVGACALAASTVAVPAYGSYKIIKHIKVNSVKHLIYLSKV